jgi:hypothetical protein
MEHELIEERTGLWKEVLRELAATSGKANVDQALKVSSYYDVDRAPKVWCLESLCLVSIYVQTL